jgi:hypothetical protein
MRKSICHSERDFRMWTETELKYGRNPMPFPWSDSCGSVAEGSASAMSKTNTMADQLICELIIEKE